MCGVMKPLKRRMLVGLNYFSLFSFSNLNVKMVCSLSGKMTGKIRGDISPVAVLGQLPAKMEGRYTLLPCTTKKTTIKNKKQLELPENQTVWNSSN